MLNEVIFFLTYTPRCRILELGKGESPQTMVNERRANQ